LLSVSPLRTPRSRKAISCLKATSVGDEPTTGCPFQTRQKDSRNTRAKTEVLVVRTLDNGHQMPPVMQICCRKWSRLFRWRQNTILRCYHTPGANC
jgi:hypothetical protein